DGSTFVTYNISLHAALPIFGQKLGVAPARRAGDGARAFGGGQRLARAQLARQHLEIRFRCIAAGAQARAHAPAQLRLRGGELERSEEHTSELQSREKLVCRL